MLSLAGALSATAIAADGGRSKIYPSQSTGAPETIVYDAASAMEYFRTLSGDWSKRGDDGSLQKYGQTGNAEHEHATAEAAPPKESAPAVFTTFNTIAAGSAVTQKYLAGSPMEMELVYHMDGANTLLQTHYCAAKNVPTTKFVKTGKPGEIKFDFLSGTNLDPSIDSHFHASTWQVKDKDTVQVTTFAYKDGKQLPPTMSIYERMPRQRSGEAR
ncbi:MAG: hypothetical protein ABW110_16430 [Steroidobacteraceae bacterium]